jgi:hypothetical protein
MLNHNTLHAGREHPPRNQTVLYPLHRNVLFSANGWSLVNMFDHNVLKFLQVRVGGILEFGNGFNTSGTHRYNNARNKSTAVIEFFISDA